MSEDLDLSSPLKIFYSYSHRDEQFRIGLANAIALLRRQGLIQEWHDRNIVAGTDWNGAIDGKIETADLIALLISPDFIASDYCYGKEMAAALDRQARGEADVIPIVVRNTDLTNAPFAHLQYLPKDGVAIAEWPSIDSAYKDVAVGIRTAVDRIRHHRVRTTQDLNPAAHVREDRVLDAAIAQEIPLHEPREVAVQVRLRASEGLGLAVEQDAVANLKETKSYSCRADDVRSSEPFRIPWSLEDVNRGDIALSLRLDAPKLENPTVEKNIKVHLFRDSGVFIFFVIASVEGTYDLTAQLLCKNFSLAERILKTSARKHQGPPAGPGLASEWVIASCPLEVRAKAIGAVASGA